MEENVKQAKVLCKPNFELDDYYVVVDGVYYKLNKNKLEKSDEVSSGIFTVEIPFILKLEAAEPDLKKLKEVADKLLTDESKKKSKPTGLRTGVAPVKEKFESFPPHQLLDKYESAINIKLKEAGSRFSFDANTHVLIDDKTKFKIEFHENGSTKSDLYTELDDPNLAQNLVDAQIAIVKTFQTLLKETGGSYPKGITNLYLIQEGLTKEDKKKVDETIMPAFKKRLRTELLKPEFNNIRHLLLIESETVEEKKQVEKSVEKKESSAQGLAV